MSETDERQEERGIETTIRRNNDRNGKGIREKIRKETKLRTEYKKGRKSVKDKLRKKSFPVKLQRVT
jgi:hypothetical protein